MLVEQRSLPRRRSSEPAMASLGKAVSMSCVVTDISRKGARLSFGVSVSLPPRFDICLARTGELLEVRLVWQRVVMPVSGSAPISPTGSRI